MASKKKTKTSKLVNLNRKKTSTKKKNITLGKGTSGSAINSKSPNQKCILYNTETKKTLYTQFNPKDLPRSREVNYTTITSPGMAYPLTQFIGGDIEVFDIELFFYDKGNYTGQIEEADAFFDSLMPPYKNKKKWYKPPVFKFTYGTFVCNLVVTKKAVKEEERDFKGRPIMATYTLSVRRV